MSSPIFRVYKVMSLKQFEVYGKLGSGSFGVVFRAKRKDTGQICVLKQVELTKMDKRMKEWSMNEAKIMKDISSEYIVKYYQSFIEKGKFYICMEYCSGGDLAQFLKGQMGKPVNEETVWRFSLQIMLGLKDLHAKKILHRDIKAMNVFLTDNKKIRIGDLGVARTMTSDFANTIVGTPYYLSPQMCEERPYNEKTDVWAMGCLIYELCTGKHPFEANSQAALALKIVVGKYQALPAHYSPLMSWLIKLCLSVDYKRRPTIQYLLSQPDVINKANAVGISLDPPKVIKKEEEKPKAEPIKQNKQPQKVIKVDSKPSVVERNAEVRQVIPKKSGQDYFKKEEERRSIERNRSKSNDRNEKNKPKEIIKRQVRPSIPQLNKYLPPKDIKDKKVAQVKPKPQISEKKVINEEKIVKVSKPSIPVAEKKDSPKKVEPIKQNKAQKMELLIDSKPKGSNANIQQVVDDDELFRDFGITPEKIVTLQEKVEFKKVNNINWDICEQSTNNNIEGTTASKQLKELPTIKTPSSCELVAVDSKQMQDDEDIVAEEIDDNAPYKSDDEDDEDLKDVSAQTLLLDDEMEGEIEQSGELKKKQRIQMLNKKIFENEKRKKELIGLKKQGENDLLGKMDKVQFDKIKLIVCEGSQEEIEKIAMKQLKNGAGIVKFYKIFHFQLEIKRCDDNITKCKENIAQLDELN